MTVGRPCGVRGDTADVHEPFPDRWPSLDRRAFDGAYCRLEPLDPATHGDELFDAIGGAEAARLHRWLPDPPPGSRDEFEEWLVSRSASQDPMYFAVIDCRTGRVEGRQSLMDVNVASGSAEIGHILWGPRIARTRVATEAFYLIADWVFRNGYRRFQWRCNARNEPSRRAALRFGYAFEGIFRQHMVVKGENRDTAWYSILDSDWESLSHAYAAWLDPSNFDATGRQVMRLHEFRAASRSDTGCRPVDRVFAPGVFYEDCRYHPMVCVSVDGDDLVGVDLLTGAVGACSIEHCGPTRFTPDEAIERRMRYREYLAANSIDSARLDGWDPDSPLPLGGAP